MVDQVDTRRFTGLRTATQHGEGRWSPLLVVGYALAGILALFLLSQGLKGTDPQDEGQFLTYPWLIGLGRVPYRDIWMSYPPAAYVLLVPLSKFGLPAVAAERTLGIILRLLYVGVVNRLAAGRWLRFSWIGLVTTVALIYLASDAKMYPWIVALPMLIAGFATLRERPYLAATLFFCAGLFRFEYAGCGLVALGLCAVLPGSASRRYALLRPALLLLCSTVVFYALLALATDGTAFQEIFADQIITVQRGRYIPLSSMTPGFLVVCLPVLAATAFLPPALIALGLLTRRPHIAATNVATLILLPHIVQRLDTSHVFSTAAIVIPWAAICLRGVQHEKWGSRTTAGTPGAVVGHVRATIRLLSRSAEIGAGGWAALVAVSYGIYLSPVSPISPTPPRMLPSLIVNGQESIIENDIADARADRAVIHYLRQRSAPRNRIMILPASLWSAYTRTDLYRVIGLVPSGRYLEIQPNVETQPLVQRQMIRALATTRWVLLVRGGRWYGPVAKPPTAVDRYVRRHFRPVLRNRVYMLMEAGRQ